MTGERAKTTDEIEPICGEIEPTLSERGHRCGEIAMIVHKIWIFHHVRERLSRIRAHTCTILGHRCGEIAPTCIEIARTHSEIATFFDELWHICSKLSLRITNKWMIYIELAHVHKKRALYTKGMAIDCNGF